MIFPVFRWFGDRSPLSASARMIREHSAWLTRMLRDGSARVGRIPPRIPVRRVSEGGFSRLTSTPTGRSRAERWWERTLERLDD
jgi:hypothetical protein